MGSGMSREYLLSHHGDMERGKTLRCQSLFLWKARAWRVPIEGRSSVFTVETWNSVVDDIAYLENVELWGGWALALSEGYLFGREWDGG